MDTPDVILLHGLGADHRAFQRFSRILPDSWNITALDLLGHGDAPHPESGYAMDDHADYIASVLMERRKAEGSNHPFTLVGHSYGAATSVALAARHPQLVEQIVLMDPVVDPQYLDPHDTAAIALAEARSSLTREMIEARRNGTVAETVHHRFADQSAPLREWTIDTWNRMAVGVVDELDGNWMRFGPGVTCPVTIVHGDREVGGAGDFAADYFDDPQVVRIPGAGHYLHATHARQTAEAVANAVTQ